MPTTELWVFEFNKNVLIVGSSLVVVAVAGHQERKRGQQRAIKTVA